MPNPDRRMKDIPCLGMAEDALFSAAGFDQTFGEYAGRVLAIDPSGRGEDETGYAVGFQLNGYIWVPEAGGLPGGYDHNTLEFLAKLAKKHKVTKVVVESNFGDGMYTRLFEPILLKHHKCEVTEVRHSTMKEARMLDTLEPVFSQHRLVVDPSVFKKDVESCERYEGDMKTFKTLAYQFTRLCRERGALRKDDRADAFSIMVAEFTEIMNQDAEKSAMEERRRLMEEALLRHVNNGIHTGRMGGPKRGRSFISRLHR